MVMRIGDGTHHKKRHSQSQFHTKGATPIEKNVIVVDEQGNEYEATYPKRAKGLVKNGRARFVGENKICLACPPDTILEEEKMENNKLTVSDIFEQITLLQKQLTESSYTSLHRLTDALSAFEGEDESETRFEHITDVCDVFRTRELNIRRMLEMYERMYDDLMSEETRRVNLVKSAFDSNMAKINESDMATEDKFAALNYVTDKIAELVDKVISAKEK